MARSELGTVLSAKFANDRSLEAKLVADGKEDYKRAIEMDKDLDAVARDAARGDNNYLNEVADDTAKARNALVDFIKENLDLEKVKKKCRCPFLLGN